MYVNMLYGNQNCIVGRSTTDLIDVNGLTYERVNLTGHSAPVRHPAGGHKAHGSHCSLCLFTLGRVTLLRWP